MTATDSSEMRPGGKEAWGRVLELQNLSDLFKDKGAPKQHVRGVHPPAGIDHMRLKTIDVFRIPGKGEFKVDFSGYFRVLRSEPDRPEFHKATVYVNIIDLKLFGSDATLGDITVDLNPNVVSAGNTYPARDGVNAACAINVAARFHIPSINNVLFNKTPIQLKNPAVQGIPTIGEEGEAWVNSLPLYEFDAPNGELIAYVEELNYQVLDYATQEEVGLFTAANSMTELKQLAVGKNVRL